MHAIDRLATNHTLHCACFGWWKQPKFAEEAQVLLLLLLCFRLKLGRERPLLVVSP
jgi:hypothetical protein